MAQVSLYPTGDIEIVDIDYHSGTGGYFEDVDEVVADNSTTIHEYRGDSTWSRCIFSQTPTIKGGKINYVRVHARVWAETETYSQIRSYITTHGTTYNDLGEVITFPKTWIAWFKDWTLNPYTNSLWNWSEIYQLAFGYGMYCSAHYYAVRVTQCYAIVDYTPDDPKANISPGEFMMF